MRHTGLFTSPQLRPQLRVAPRRGSASLMAHAAATLHSSLRKEAANKKLVRRSRLRPVVGLVGPTSVVLFSQQMGSPLPTMGEKFLLQTCACQVLRLPTTSRLRPSVPESLVDQEVEEVKEEAKAKEG